MVGRELQAKSVLFHVGLPKAGSSFLQKQVFPAVTDATFLSLSSANLGHLPKVRSGSAAFLSDHAVARQAILEAEHRKVIVSAEGFVGDPYRSFFDHRSRAEALKTIWPDATVLLVIRRQDRFCQSLFGQVLRKGYPYSPTRFLMLDERQAAAPTAARHFDYRAADLDLLVATYEQLFGSDHVTVVPLELLAADRTAFLDIVRGAGAYSLPDLPAASPENVAYSRRGLYAAMVLNRLCVDEYESGKRVLAWLDGKAAAHGGLWPALRKVARHSTQRLRRRVRVAVTQIDGGGRKAAQPLPADQLDRILRHFAAGNQRLSERRSLGLERYGYF